MKRGTKVVDPYGRKGSVMSAKDFSGYEYNRPSDKWELVHWETGEQSWIGTPLIGLQGTE